MIARPPTQEPPEPAVPTSPFPIIDTASPPKKKMKRSFSVAAVCGTSVVALLVGYFAGREHIKYEMRSALANVGEAFKDGMKKAFNVDGNNPRQLNEEDVAFEKQPHMTLGQVHTAQGFSLALVDVRIDHAELKSILGGDPVETDERYLLCTFRITNIHERKILNFGDSGSFGPNNFALVDDVKNRIRGVSFGFSNKLIGAVSTTDDIPPGEQRTHLEVFTIPPPKTQHLILTINLQAFDGDGRIKYQIPINKIKGFNANNK